MCVCVCVCVATATPATPTHALTYTYTHPPGVAFRNGTNPAFIQQFSDGIQVLQDNGDLQLLRSNFVGGAGGKCDTGSANQSTTAISFMELYVLLGVYCIGVYCIGVYCIGVYCIGVYCIGVALRCIWT